MFNGQVYSQGEHPVSGKPWLLITIANPDNPALTAEIWVLVDTGSTGHLSIPPDTVQKLELSRFSENRVEIAGGQIASFSVYRVLVDWHGRGRVVPALEMPGEPLLGMAMLWGSRLTVDAVEGGAVVIEEIPASA